MDEQGYLDQIAALTDERDEAQAESASAGIDAGELEELRASNATAEETLALVQTRLTESEDKRALSTFTTKRDKAIKELGIAENHPAIALAFPGETVLDDATFDSALGSLKEIAALSAPKAPDPPDPLKGDDERNPALDEWGKFQGSPSGDGAPPSEMTQDEKHTLAARAKFTETRNPWDLVGGLGNVIKRIVTRKTPGNSKYYETERVQ